MQNELMSSVGAFDRDRVKDVRTGVGLLVLTRL